MPNAGADANLVDVDGVETSTSGAAYRGSANAVHFAPSRLRRGVAAGILAFFGFGFFAFLILFASMAADAVVPRTARTGPWPLLAAAAWIWFCSYGSCYLANVSTRSLTLGSSKVTLETLSCRRSIDLEDLTKVTYRDTLRGWMYVIFYTASDALVVTNWSFFDNEFRALKKALLAYLQHASKSDLIDNDRVTAVGLFRNKAMPAFVSIGLWKWVAFYTVFFVAVTAACLVFDIRPNALIMYHRPLQYRG